MTKEAQDAFATVKQVDTINGIPVIQELTEHQQEHVYCGGLGLSAHDGKLTHYSLDHKFTDLIPRCYERITCTCGNFELHILYTAAYETSAYCPKCRRLWHVHEG